MNVVSWALIILQYFALSQTVQNQTSLTLVILLSSQQIGTYKDTENKSTATQIQIQILATFI